MELALSGRRMPSEEALQVGLLSGLSTPEDLLFDAVTLAEQLGKLPSLAFRAAKDSMNVALEAGGISVSALADRYRSVCLQSTDETRNAQAAWREQFATRKL
jgi:enoyl-CoA hydratase/carnithine racemase